jgi:HKD family nuclease
MQSERIGEQMAEYKIDIKNEKHETIQTYNCGFSTYSDLSHILLDVIIEHLEKGWYIIISVVGILVLFFIFGG